MSLAPSLISIYDHAVATTGGEGENEHVSGWYDGAGAMPGGAAADAEADIDRLATSAASSTSSRSSTVVKRATSSAPMAFPGGSRPDVDMKKRPLSIRSTSSTASTVSATQHRRRKKQAVGDGVVVGGALPDVEGELPPLTERLSQQVASYSDELNSLTSSLLERSESDSSGADGGVARLSSLLTDDDDQDADASPSSDCSDVGGPPVGTSRSESYVDMVVAEILDTERAYVNDLRDVIQVL